MLPGFANNHSHAFHRALRGRTHHERGTFWTWRRRMYELAARLEPDSYYRLACGMYAEMVLSGYTSVGEFHYVHHAPGGKHYADPNAMSAALVRAAADAGIRITLLDACYLAGGFRPRTRAVPSAFQRWRRRTLGRTVLDRRGGWWVSGLASCRVVPLPRDQFAVPGQDRRWRGRTPRSSGDAGSDATTLRVVPGRCGCSGPVRSGGVAARSRAEGQVLRRSWPSVVAGARLRSWSGSARSVS